MDVPGSYERDVRALRVDVAGLRHLENEVEPDRKRIDELRMVELKSRQSCDGGIIDFLTAKCGNIHEPGVIEITSNGTYTGQDPENPADLHMDMMFWSPSRPN